MLAKVFFISENVFLGEKAASPCQLDSIFWEEHTEFYQSRVYKKGLEGILTQLKFY